MLEIVFVWKDNERKPSYFNNIESIKFPTLMDYPNVYRLHGKDETLKYIISQDSILYIHVKELKE